MLIDTHQHSFWRERDAAGLIADMDAHGIDLAWLLTWEIAPFEDRRDCHGILNPLAFRTAGTHGGMRFADKIKTRDLYPGRFVLGYCPHPLLGSAPQLFESAYRIHGVRVCGEWKFRIPFDDPRCIEMFRKAGELKCPVVLHLDVPFLPDENGKPKYFTNWYGGTVENLERALAACPETIFLGHAPGFWREISGDADATNAQYPRGPIVPGGKVQKLLDRYPNLWCDLSAGSALYALQRNSRHAEEFLIRYADRLTFARDQYGQDHYEFLKTLTLPQDVKDKIYFQNALKLVPVKAPAMA